MKFIIFKSFNFLFVFFSIICFSQEKYFVILNNKNQKEIVINENKRIIVKTIDGNKLIGKLNIVDKNTIKINDELIILDSIHTIKQRSLFNSITRPILFTTGSIAVSLGVMGAFYGGYGYIATVTLVPAGLIIILPPLLSKIHDNKKYSYSIKSSEN